MLQKIRDRISGWFAAVFLGAIAIVFIFWGIQFESSVTNEAASVNGEEIPARLVQQAWQDRQSELQQQIRDELPPELVRAEQQRLLDGFIDRELMVQRARKSGYHVSDRELAETLRQIPALQVDGQFSRDRYAALLRQQGRSEAEFEREFRRDLESNQLRNAIAVSSFVTPAEMERRIALEGESREVAYAVIPAAGFAAQAEVTPEAVAAHYEKNKTQYVTPETVSLQYLRLDLADIAANVQVTEENLRKFYEETAARNETPERRRASHILVESGSDDAAAKKEAEEVAARAKGGADFAGLAREHSDDLGSKAAGGDLGWATRDAYVKEFADALFAMQKEGEIVGPVRTQYGYHVIRLDGIEAPHVRSFEEVRAELEPEYRREVAQSEFYEKSQQLADESFAALSELDSVAKKLGLPLQTVDGFTRQGGGTLGNDRKIIEAAFSDEVLQDRQNSQPIQLGEESVVVLRVADHQPSQQRPLEEVRDEITAQLREEAARKAAADAAVALARRIEAGEPLDAVAASAGAKATGKQTVDRQGPTEDNGAPVPPELVKAIFQAPRPAGEGKSSVGTATLASGDQAVFVAPAGVAERLQKFLAQRGLGSRRGIEEWIRAQRLTVNGRVAELGQKVTAADDIRLDGRPIRTRASAAAQAFMFNRSPGDPLRESTAERQALVERLPKTAGRRFVAISPMPGIDGGLELVTSDGALAAKLQRSIHRLPTEFTVRVKALLGPDQLAGVESGKLDRAARMTVESVSASDADLEGSNRWYSVRVRGASGKDIRQLFERQGVLVSRVLRVAVGDLKLDKSLSRGQFRRLEDDEVAALVAGAPD